MPGDAGVLVVARVLFATTSAHETAGAAGIRHPPRPLWAEDLAQLGRFAPRERSRMRNSINVIASAAKQSTLSSRREMDCFAALAMTVWFGCLKESRICADGIEPPLPLWERVGVRGQVYRWSVTPHPDRIWRCDVAEASLRRPFPRTAAEGGLCSPTRGEVTPSISVTSLREATKHAHEHHRHRLAAAGGSTSTASASSRHRKISTASTG
jgi:hypothetical protein